MLLCVSFQTARTFEKNNHAAKPYLYIAQKYFGNFPEANFQYLKLFGNLQKVNFQPNIFSVPFQT